MVKKKRFDPASLVRAGPRDSTATPPPPESGYTVTSGTPAKRSPDSKFRRRSPVFAALRVEARAGPFPRQCQQTSC